MILCPRGAESRQTISAGDSGMYGELECGVELAKAQGEEGVQGRAGDTYSGPQGFAPRFACGVACTVVIMSGEYVKWVVALVSVSV